MTDDALIERAAAEVASSVLALDRAGWAGLMLYMYGESLSAVAWGMPDLEPPLEISSDTMAELGMLDGDGEAVAALRARVDSGPARPARTLPGTAGPAVLRPIRAA